MRKIVLFLLTLACVVCVLPMLQSCQKETKVYIRYEITAEYSPENKTLAGVEKVTFENGGDNEISVLKFQLYPNAYRENALYKPVSTAYRDSAYYAGESYGEMVISSVNGSKGWEVSGEDKNILCVYLLEPLYPEDKVVIDIAFMTKLANVNHRTGVTASTVNLGNAFPILCGVVDGGFYECVYYADGDPFFSDCAEYKLNLTLPKEYVLASTGERMEERTLESKKAYTVSAMNARDFAMVLSTKYRLLCAESGGKRIEYYYYADKNAAETLSAVTESFAYFERTFGGYPYPVYTVAETDLYCGGMEYPCLSMLSSSLQGEARIRAAVHETAHQWWNVAVGSNSLENAWQDEGIAEYSAIAFFENYEKYGVKREDAVTDALREYRSYYDVYGSVLGRMDTRMTRHLKEFISEYEYRCLSYDKAVVMLDTLRKSVGDKKFFGALKKYYAENIFRNATVADFVGSFERVGLDVHGYFDGFLNGKVIL